MGAQQETLIAIPGLGPPRRYAASGSHVDAGWSALAALQTGLLRADRLVAVCTPQTAPRVPDLLDGWENELDVDVVTVGTDAVADPWAALAKLAALDWNEGVVHLDTATGLRSLVVGLTVAWVSLPALHPGILRGAVVTASKLASTDETQLTLDSDAGPTIEWLGALDHAIEGPAPARVIAAGSRSRLGSSGRPESLSRVVHRSSQLADAIGALDLPRIRTEADRLFRADSSPGPSPIGEVLHYVNLRLKAWGEPLRPSTSSAVDVLRSELALVQRLLDHSEHHQALIVLREVCVGRALAARGLTPRAWESFARRELVTRWLNRHARSDRVPLWTKVTTLRNDVAHAGYGREENATGVSATQIAAALTELEESLDDLGSSFDPWRADTHRWISTADAARALGITTRTLYRLVNSGDLSAYRFGRMIRIKREDVERFIAASRIELGSVDFPRGRPGADGGDDESESEDPDEGLSGTREPRRPTGPEGSGSVRLDPPE